MFSRSAQVRPSRTRRAVALSALFALLLGAGVYLLDRDWDSVRLLAPLSDLQPQAFGWFGSPGYMLPSLLHAYAFTVLLILALGPYRHARAAGTLVWFTVAATMELLQADGFDPLFEGSTAQLSGPFWIEGMRAYFLNGYFDAGDLWGTALGCVTACVVTAAVEKHT